MAPKMFCHLCHPQSLPPQPGNFMPRPGARLMIFHLPSLSQLQLESKSALNGLRSTDQNSATLPEKQGASKATISSPVRLVVSRRIPP